ncbi:hypothetical protein BaRGS_00029073 [Batillaria attramentaria]|uniref:Uncharacterized protein n=1 Tax=Batillaria attramentaria TaxID=370345 RepID=A0ABD0JXF2_9CAEN
MHTLNEWVRKWQPYCVATHCMRLAGPANFHRTRDHRIRQQPTKSSNLRNETQAVWQDHQTLRSKCRLKAYFHLTLQN